MSELITDYSELHTTDVIYYNGQKLIVIDIYLNANGFYYVNCFGVKESKIYNIRIPWGKNTSVERLGHISFSTLIDNALKEYEEETKKEI